MRANYGTKNNELVCFHTAGKLALQAKLGKSKITISILLWLDLEKVGFSKGEWLPSQCEVKIPVYLRGQCLENHKHPNSITIRP